MQAKNSLHSAARSYAEAGIKVFPCLPGSKEPATTHSFQDASCDLAQIDAWWSQNPEYNLALSPGDNGWGVVDLDEGEIGKLTWAKLQEVHGKAPETFEVITPKGGRHIYFEGELKSRVRKLGEGVDTRGVGGYVLVEPSVIDARSGKSAAHWGPYRTVNHDLVIAPIPPWLPVIAGADKTKQAAATNLQDQPHQIAKAIAHLRGLPEVVQGQGADNAAYVAASWCANFGLSEEKTVEIMTEHFKAFPRDERWEAFIGRKVANAFSYAQNEPGAYASPLAPEEAFATYMPDPTKAPSYKYRLYGEVDMDGWREPRWLVPRWLPEEGLAVLYGLPGTLKTFAALDLSLFLSTGQAGWGRAGAPPAPVVYLAYESPSAIGRERRPAWRMVHGQVEQGQFKILKDALPRAYDPDSVIQMVEDIKAQGVRPAMVVVDTWARFLGGLDENNARDAGAAVEALDFIRKAFGCLVLVIAHASPKGGHGPRGSSALEGAADTMIEVKREKGSLAVALWCQKQKDAKEPTAPLTFEARTVGPSLVLFPTTAKEHMLASGQSDAFAPDKIGAALVRLGATAQDALVSTHVLAAEMLPHSDIENAEERQEAVGRMERALRQRAKPGRPLNAYCVWANGQWLWGILTK